MKLRSGRKYKHDLSDVIGILAEHKKRGEDLVFTQVEKAVIELYDSWEAISADVRQFINDAFENGNYEEIISSVIEEEKNAKELLVDFEQDYPNVTNQANVNDILANLKKRKDAK